MTNSSNSTQIQTQKQMSMVHPQQQPGIRLHWSPIEASWIVSIGLVLLAALPHQVPSTGRSILTHPVGWILFAGATVYVFWLKPIVGIAMSIFLAGITLPALFSYSRENFENRPSLTVDVIQNKHGGQGQGQGQVKSRHRWLDEIFLSETPEAIQKLTDDPAILYDKVTPQESAKWFSEDVLGEHPVAIQETPVLTESDRD
jgi:hypothetical protein